jgi:hypothetical protein
MNLSGNIGVKETSQRNFNLELGRAYAFKSLAKQRVQVMGQHD